MCINIHEWTTLSRKITRFCGTMGKQELFGAENWWQETIIILIYEKQDEFFFRTFWKYFFGLDILTDLKFWMVPEKSRDFEEFWEGLAAWETKPRKHVFERRWAETCSLSFIFGQQRVLMSSTMPQKMNCIRLREPSHRSTEKSRLRSPTPLPQQQCTTVCSVYTVYASVSRRPESGQIRKSMYLEN